MLSTGKGRTRPGDFRWEIPARFNIGVDICDRWAAKHPDRTAILDIDDQGGERTFTYARLRAQSNRLANALVTRGVASGDRVAVLMPQRAEVAIAHIAVHKLGAISLPLFALFGPDALLHRLHDSGTRTVIADRAGAEKLSALRDRLPALAHVLILDDDGPESYRAALAEADEAFTPADTAADDPALLIYTSGTTGNPKGALHAHRVLLGHLPGVEISHDFLPQPGDLIWTPADWAWIGGLLDVLMPALHHGVPVVARRFSKFTAEAAFGLLREKRIRNTFLPPTALKMMRRAPEHLADGLCLRSVASGGEPLGAELLEWGRRVFGVEINEFYGQTECNMIVSACGVQEPATPGVMGAPVPGHDVRVLDHAARPCPDGTEGVIAVHAPDPVMFLRYWNAPEATEAKFATGPGGRWLLTGDRGVMRNGKIRFIGRDDDVISSGGYRIGPGEVEDCLMTHPAVHLAGVIGVPDPLRGEVVAAYIQLVEGAEPSDALATDIADRVRTRLAAHEYPRIVRFIGTMPLTTTGKIIRAELRAMARAGSPP
ncbi:acetyl-CoA synthetase [Rhodovulum imhoffii]|uniref:Acetyl-CoA synthetase n=1 Tax=Rhodovulum imhoffii TaxID=365340 RepID=A0A2T5BTZ9_9RHOB|nr:AMP-binding protein [Rhodovulum imhoffii]MBK5932740.1 AMP-dependent synthetase [Rhodovulum imhoffii]PTN02947.1 acetyl-CoA synthetase [Rhodovulum imhoffii]